MAEDNGFLVDTELAPLQASKSSWSTWSLIGPGLLVCLADTDAGCLIVAAQSGYRWGYSLLPLQVILIPILYAAQELTVRLAMHTRQGLTTCIRNSYGKGWALFTCFILLLECVAAMVSEMSGIAAVAELWGINRVIGTLIAVFLVVSIVVLCNYRQIEAVGVAFGLFELTFVVTMFIYQPDLMEVLRGSFEFHNDPEYSALVTANIGAVIMPWMLYFQQSACVARRVVTKDDLAQERTHTMIGSFLTQLVMIGALVTLAAARVGTRDLHTVGEIVDALTPVLGYNAARAAITLAFLGGSLCASFVVSLAATWAVTEALELDEQFSLDKSPSEAPYFYGCFLTVIFLGAAILFTGVNIVQLNLFVEFLDGLLLPFAIGFLFFLTAQEAMPIELRLHGIYKYVLGAVFLTVSGVSVVSGIHGIFGL